MNFTQLVSPVDVVLELVGARTFSSSLRVLKNGGRIVFIGNLDLAKINVNPGYLIMKEISVMGSSEATREDMAEIIKLVQDKKLKPVVEKVMPLSEFSSAQKKLEERGACGRIVLVPKL